MLKRECLKGAPLGQAPTLLTNIRQVWKVRVLTLGQYLQPYLSVISTESTLVEHLLGDPFGQAPALFINIRPSWKYLPGTNALVYLASLFMMTKKSFNILAPVHCHWDPEDGIPASVERSWLLEIQVSTLYNIFSSHIVCENKLEYFSKARFAS